MFKVIKRSGFVVDFDTAKIICAIRKAMEATNTPMPQERVLNKILNKIVSEIEPQVPDQAVGIEIIQDSVERILADFGYFSVAKAYILYRLQHQNIRNVTNHVINYSEIMNGYLKRIDWRVKENSTIQYTLGG